MNKWIKLLLSIIMDLILLITVQTLVTFIFALTVAVFYGQIYITPLTTWTIRLISAVIFVYIQILLMKRRNK